MWVVILLVWMGFDWVDVTVRFGDGFNSGGGGGGSLTS